MPPSEDTGRHMLAVGQEFMTAQEGRARVEDYTLERGKSICAAPKSGGRNLRYICTSDNCTFFVQLCKRQYKNRFCPWYISSVNFTHVNCTALARSTWSSHTARPTWASPSSYRLRRT